MTRIIGIDPGSVITGIGIVDSGPRGLTHVHHEAVETGGGDFPLRLKVIFEGVMAAIAQFQPDAMAVERVFVAKNADSALKLGQARGAAICAGVSCNLPVAEYAAREIKLAVVGRGGADKRQVQHMIGILLGLKGNIPADPADALGVAVCHSHHLETESRLARQGVTL